MSKTVPLPPGAVLLVAHDAGGAQLLSHWQNHVNPKALHVLEGPARRIFRDNRCRLNEVSLESGLASADWVLTGSSWGSNIENQAIRLSRAVGKTCVTFLDHWADFSARFLFQGQLVLPDEIWVGDSYAYRLARAQFPATRIVQTGNPYVTSLRNFFRKAEIDIDESSAQQDVALWVGENIDGAAKAQRPGTRIRGYTEIEAVNYFLCHLDLVDAGIKLLRVRPHPSDGMRTYAKLRNTRGVKIELADNSISLEQQMLDVKVVASSDSFGLVVGVVAGKRTISAIPPGGSPRSVPLSEIEDLQTIAAAASSI